MKKILLTAVVLSVMAVFAANASAKDYVRVDREVYRESVWRYVPGYYTTEYRRVLVRAGYYDRVWIPPQGHWERRGEELVYVEETRGHWESHWVPPVYKYRRVRIYHPGYWVNVYTGERIPEGSWPPYHPPYRYYYPTR